MAHTDALNTIAIFSENFRSIVQNAESRSMNPVKTLEIDRNEFVKWTELAESTRIKLIKTEDSSMNEENLKELSEASLITTKFSKTDSNIVDILDVCSGNLNHVNLKQVSVLESNLSQLFKKLSRLKESLKTNLNEKDLVKSTKKGKTQMLPLHQESLRSQLEDCCKQTQDSCTSLFDLTLIVPSAPWPTVKKSPIDKITQESLIAKLKSIGLPKSKYPAVEVLFKSYYVASNYHHHMKSNELAAANEEIKFYRSSYSIQKDYIETVMNLFMKKYEQFIDELRGHINVPLKHLIDKFWAMKTDTSEENLKEFLAYFKNYAKKFDLVISNIENMPNNDLIGGTFNEILSQLNAEITRLNDNCQGALQEFDINKLDLQELSTQSDHIFREVISLTPEDSPTGTPVPS